MIFERNSDDPEKPVDLDDLPKIFLQMLLECRPVWVVKLRQISCRKRV